MLGVESQGQAFQPDKPNFPPPEIKRGEFSGGDKNKEPAKIIPFVRPDEQKKTEDLGEEFRSQTAVLISNNEVVIRVSRGFPSRIIPKEVGVYEVCEKNPATGNIVCHTFSKIERIEFG